MICLWQPEIDIAQIAFHDYRDEIISDGNFTIFSIAFRKKIYCII